MGKRNDRDATFQPIAAPPPPQLHPRARQVTFWLPVKGGVRPWAFTTETDTYLVFSADVALQCEMAGVPYTLVNAARALAVDVSDHVPGEELRLPQPSEVAQLLAGVVEPTNGQVLQDEHLRFKVTADDQAGTG